MGRFTDRQESGRDTVAVSSAGDGGSNQGTAFEAMNMAVVLQLPAIFVFENNQNGEGTGVGSLDIAGRAAGFGLPAVKVSGDDFFAVHEAAGEAGARARTGGGPSAIEVDTCRFYGHHSGDAQLYRGKDEVTRLREERDCLKYFRRRVGERIAAALVAMRRDPFSGVVHLGGSAIGYRRRVGAYRILFALRVQEQRFHVTNITRRTSTTY